MALSSQSFSSPGNNPQNFDITDFEFLREKYLTVYVDGSSGGVAWSLSGDRVTVTSTLVAGSVVLIERITDLADVDFLVQFQDPSTLRAEDLQTSVDQLLHICQEINEGRLAEGAFLPAAASGLEWDAGGKRILAGPTDITTISVPTEFATKGYIDAAVLGDGVLPIATSFSIGEVLIIGDNDPNAWTVKSQFSESSVYTMIGPGYAGGYNHASFPDAGGAMHVAPDTSPDTLSSEDVKAMVWTRTGYSAHESLQDANGCSLNLTDDKTFTIISVIGGWNFELNIQCFPRMRVNQIYADETQPVGFRVAFWDVTNDQMLNLGDDYINITYGGVVDFDTSGNANPYKGAKGTEVEEGLIVAGAGDLEFPQNQWYTPGKAQWNDLTSKYTYDLGAGSGPSIANDGALTSVTITGMLPVTGPSMMFRIIPYAFYYGSQDHVMFARPTTFRIWTGPGYTNV